jgi:hypothetical protein
MLISFTCIGYHSYASAGHDPVIRQTHRKMEILYLPSALIHFFTVQGSLRLYIYPSAGNHAVHSAEYEFMNVIQPRFGGQGFRFGNIRAASWRMPSMP